MNDGTKRREIHRNNESAGGYVAATSGSDRLAIHNYNWESARDKRLAGTGREERGDVYRTN